MTIKIILHCSAHTHTKNPLINLASEKGTVVPQHEAVSIFAGTSKATCSITASLQKQKQSDAADTCVYTSTRAISRDQSCLKSPGDVLQSRSRWMTSLPRIYFFPCVCFIVCLIIEQKQTCVLRKVSFSTGKRMKGIKRINYGCVAVCVRAKFLPLFCLYFSSHTTNLQTLASFHLWSKSHPIYQNNFCMFTFLCHFF